MCCVEYCSRHQRAAHVDVRPEVCRSYSQLYSYPHLAAVTKLQSCISSYNNNSVRHQRPGVHWDVDEDEAGEEDDDDRLAGAAVEETVGGRVSRSTNWMVAAASGCPGTCTINVALTAASDRTATTVWRWPQWHRSVRSTGTGLVWRRTTLPGSTPAGSGHSRGRCR